jgi:FkbM family methyltransferase
MAEYDSGKAHVNRTPFTVFTDRYGGLQFMAKANTDAGKHMIENGIFEWNLITWSFQLADKDKIFVDIGAHVGTWSNYMAPLFKSVHAFEAQKMTFHALNGSVAANGFQNITTHHVALGPPEQHQTFQKLNIVSADGGGSSLLPEILEHSSFNFGTEDIEVRTLDSYDLANIGLIKIDVEGYELEVLQGALQTITRCDRPKIIFEVWPEAWYQTKAAKLFKFLTSIGYKIIFLRGFTNMYLAEANPNWIETAMIEELEDDTKAISTDDIE